MKLAAVTVAAILLGEVAEAANLKPPPFIRGKEVCAKNVNAFMKKLKKRSTGSASSRSFLKFKRTSSPRPGDVVFNSRGKSKGHVQVYDGNGMCWNPSAKKQRWVYQSCTASWRKAKKTYIDM